MKATLHTNHGPIVVELFANEAPKTVANFTGLASGTKDYTDDAGRSTVDSGAQGARGASSDAACRHHVAERGTIRRLGGSVGGDR